MKITSEHITSAIDHACNTDCARYRAGTCPYTLDQEKINCFHIQEWLGYFEREQEKAECRYEIEIKSCDTCLCRKTCELVT